MWTPTKVYRLSVLTNDDVESWHRRLNSLARDGRLPLYQQLLLLFVEDEQFDQML